MMEPCETDTPAEPCKQATLELHVRIPSSSRHLTLEPNRPPDSVFNFIPRNSPEERKLMTAELLNLRIKEIMDARSRGGDSTESPSVTYVKTVMKPFADIRRPGTMCFGQEVTIRIDPYGNFEHKMPAVSVSIPGVRVVPDPGGPPADTCRYQPSDGQLRFEHDEK
jgi:hypothetical protein